LTKVGCRRPETRNIHRYARRMFVLISARSGSVKVRRVAYIGPRSY
jgi:hypothetical protein